MKRIFNFVNIAGNAFTEIPNAELHIIEPEEYAHTGDNMKGLLYNKLYV